MSSLCYKGCGHVPVTPRKNLVRSRPLKSFARAVRELTTAHRAMNPAMYHDGLTLVRIMSVESASDRSMLDGALTAWDLPEEISDKQNRNTGLILGRGQIEVLFQIIETSQGNGIPV